MPFLEHFFNFHPELAGLTIFIFVLGLSFITRALLLNRIHKWAAFYQSPFTAIFPKVLQMPTLFLCFLIAFYLGIQFYPAYIAPNPYFNKAFGAAIILTITAFSARFVHSLVDFYRFRREDGDFNLKFPAAFVQILIYISGLLLVLEWFSLNTLPFLITLLVLFVCGIIIFYDGIKSSISLFYLQMERSLNPGDFIQLEDGTCGTILDMNWRMTQLKDQSNNIVLIPNDKLAKNKITHYSLREKHFEIAIRVSTAYDTNPEFIERILLETAIDGIPNIPGMAADPPPIVRFEPGFGESSLDFTIYVHVDECSDKLFVQHELRKKIYHTFAERGVKLPHPVRTIYVSQQQNKL